MLPTQALMLILLTLSSSYYTKLDELTLHLAPKYLLWRWADGSLDNVLIRRCVLDGTVTPVRYLISRAAC